MSKIPLSKLKKIDVAINKSEIPYKKILNQKGNANLAVFCLSNQFSPSSHKSLNTFFSRIVLLLYAFVFLNKVTKIRAGMKSNRSIETPTKI